MVDIYFKRIALISDNSELAEYFCEAVNKSNFDVSVTVFTSPKTKLNNWVSWVKPELINLNEEAQIIGLIASHDLVISLHSKQLFPKMLFESKPCLNVHPGLNPHNRGWFPQAFCILNKKPAGATIHIIDEFIDHGAIVAQIAVDIAEHETSLAAYRKIIQAEKLLISTHLEKILTYQWLPQKPAFAGNYNSINDFRNLCILDMDQVGSLRQHIDLLRALSHPPYRNCYFIDKNGRKVYVELQLTLEA